MADGRTLADVVHHEEIYVANKQTHFRNLHKKTGIPFHHMLFFDNEYGNIEDVSKLGVTCFYTPNGITRDHFHEGLAQHTANVRKHKN
jgi:magnesium-dependent phosphatase 1